MLHTITILLNMNHSRVPSHSWLFRLVRFPRWMLRYQKCSVTRVNIHVYTLNSSPPQICPSFFFRSPADIWTTSCHCVEKNRRKCVLEYERSLISREFDLFKTVCEFQYMNCVEGNLTRQLNNATQNNTFPFSWSGQTCLSYISLLKFALLFAIYSCRNMDFYKVQY